MAECGKAAIVIVVLVGCTFSACTVTRWVGIESHEHVAVYGKGEAHKAAMQAIQKMRINRDAHVAVFTRSDGSKIITPFERRDRAEWPAGCPTNIGSTHMDILDIEEHTLRIEMVTLNNRILARRCPPEPVRVVLRGDGEIGGEGGACTWPTACMVFGPRQDNLKLSIPKIWKTR